MDTMNIERQLNTYGRDLRSVLFEPTMNRQLGTPPVQPYVAYLTLLMREVTTWTEEMYNSALAVGAVYASFAVHDRITLDADVVKNDQLTVLAGDHYSGIYYRLLAEAGNYSFIGKLSKAIGIVNESKTELYYETTLTKDEWSHYVDRIELQPLIAFYTEYGWQDYVNVAKLAYVHYVLQTERNVRKLHIVDIDRNEWREEVALQLRAELEQLPQLARHAPILLGDVDIEEKEGGYIAIKRRESTRRL